MSIVTLLNTTSQEQLALETVSAAAKSFYHAPSQNVRNELLAVIDETLLDRYVRYTTPQGIVIERDETIWGVHLRVEQTARSRSCPVCHADLLQQGEIVDVCTDGIAAIRCTCGQFWRLKEEERHG